MGSFANSVFNLLIGWFSGVVATVWSALSSPDGGSFLKWLGNNWIPVALFICVAGIAVDVIIYIARWRPHKVWASFFHRVGGKADDAAVSGDDSGIDASDYGRTLPDEAVREESAAPRAGEAAYMRPDDTDAAYAYTGDDTVRMHESRDYARAPDSAKPESDDSFETGRYSRPVKHRQSRVERHYGGDTGAVRYDRFDGDDGQNPARWKVQPSEYGERG